MAGAHQPVIAACGSSSRHAAHQKRGRDLAIAGDTFQVSRNRPRAVTGAHYGPQASAGLTGPALDGLVPMQTRGKVVRGETVKRNDYRSGTRGRLSWAGACHMTGASGQRIMITRRARGCHG